MRLLGTSPAPSSRFPHPPPFFFPVCRPVRLSSLVISLSFLCRRTGPPRTDPKWSRHALLSMDCAEVPALASFLSWPCGLVRGCGLRWLTLESYFHNEHFPGNLVPTPGLVLVLASRLMYENMAYSWLITGPLCFV